MKHTILRAFDADGLSRKIEQFDEEGWHLQGDFQVVQEGGRPLWVQAMVRYSRPQKMDLAYSVYGADLELEVPENIAGVA